MDFLQKVHVWVRGGILLGGGAMRGFSCIAGWGAGRPVNDGKCFFDYRCGWLVKAHARSGAPTFRSFCGSR